MSWKETTLGDLYKVASSKRVLKSDWKSEGIPFYRGREISSLSKYGYVENDLYITEEMYKEFTKNYGVPVANDIMVTAIGTIGNTYIVKNKDRFYFKDASVLWLKKEKDVDSNFVNYWFKSALFTNQLDVGLGATVDTLTIGKVQSLKINVPSLSTQQKIVAKLDAIFFEIDKATAAAEANARNAEALFQSFLNEKLETNEEGWIPRNFDEIILDKQIGLVKNSKEQIEDGMYSYFKMNNITNDNKCNLASLMKVNASNEDVRKYSLNKNDFLFNTRNSVELVGKVCIFDGEDDAGILYNNNIMRVRFKPNVNPYFILFAFSNAKVRKSIENLKTGTTNVAAIYYKDLKDLSIQVPDFAAQNKIVNQIQELYSFTNMLSLNMKHKIKNLFSLKQSILTQAFNGELVKE